MRSYISVAYEHAAQIVFRTHVETTASAEDVLGGIAPSLVWISKCRRPPVSNWRSLWPRVLIVRNTLTLPCSGDQRQCRR